MRDSVLDTQREFASNLRASQTLTGGWAVYRANSVANALAALRLTYPVIEKLVGEDFFSGLARAYWQQCPSQCGDLNQYGAEFAMFLTSFPHVADLPYLPAVAQLEWQITQLAGADDHVPAALSDFASLPPETLATQVLVLQAGWRCERAAFPVASIWLQHQIDLTDNLAIDLTQAQSWAVARCGWRVSVDVLDPAATVFWQSVQAGATLEQALNSAFELDEAFDFGTNLQRGFAAEWVTSWHDAAMTKEGAE